MDTTESKGLSTFYLKIIGLVLMVIDHIYQMFLPLGAPNWLNWFGRPVATIFFFTSVVAFSHTHSKKKYMTRLYICMVLMSLAMFGLEALVRYDQVVLINNIFRDLFIGTVFMYGVDEFKEGWSSHKVKNILAGILLFLIPFVSNFILAAIMSNLSLPRLANTILLSITPGILIAENNLMVLLIPLLYIFKDNRKIQCLLITLMAAVYGIMGSIQWVMVFSIIPIWFYNGKKGPGPYCCLIPDFGLHV